jgi:hypothetical protein
MGVSNGPAATHSHESQLGEFLRGTTPADKLFQHRSTPSAGYFGLPEVHQAFASPMRT